MAWELPRSEPALRAARRADELEPGRALDRTEGIGRRSGGSVVALDGYGCPEATAGRVRAAGAFEGLLAGLSKARTPLARAILQPLPSRPSSYTPGAGDPPRAMVGRAQPMGESYQLRTRTGWPARKAAMSSTISR